MNLFKLFYFLILTFIYINCQTYICNSNDSSDLKVGDKVYLCIHNIQNETRIAFPITVDEYSVASIKGIYNKINNKENDIEFLAQMGKTTSVFKSVSIINLLISSKRIVLFK